MKNNTIQANRPAVVEAMATLKSQFTTGSREWTQDRTSHLALHGLDAMGEQLGTKENLLSALVVAQKTLKAIASYPADELTPFMRASLHENDCDFLPIKWAHWMEGGTGVTNIPCDEDQRGSVYIQAAANLGISGITVVNRDMNGRPGCSLHDCRPGNQSDLSDFWAEVKRLEKHP